MTHRRLRSIGETREEGQMRKLAILVLSAIVAALALVSGAAADKPARAFLPASDFTISGSCSFDVGVHILVNKEYTITFSNGQFLVQGALKERLTNLSDPSKSIDLNVPGPGLFTTASDGTLTIDARGPWLFFFTDTLLYSTGHSTLVVTPDGTFTLTQQGGTSTDLCAVLR
jgi:hypothetical protein